MFLALPPIVRRLKTSEKRLALERIVHRLKGSDATVFRVCQELSLDTYLRVVYRIQYTFVMVDHVIDLSNYSVEDDIEEVLAEIGAVLLKKIPSRSGYYMLGMEALGVERVKWVTSLTPFNEMQTEYVAHGNQADLAYMYGDICSIVEIGSLVNEIPSRQRI